MNYGVVFRLLATIVTTLTLAFLACYGVGWAPSTHPEEATARAGFLVCAGLAAAAAAGLFWLGRNASPRMFRREALAVIGLGWLLASVVGALPYVFIADDGNFANAFFESASGFTTTGASVYGDVEAMPRSLLFWRALSQWVGGMGVVVFFVAVLGILGAGAKILYTNEASGSTADFDEPRVQSAVINLWLVYLGISSLCAVAYRLGGMSVYDALCHTFTTVSTGGFSTRNLSFADYRSPLLEWIAIVFMFLGGCSFVLLARAFRGRFDTLRANTEFHAYWILLAGATLAITPFLLGSDGVTTWTDALRTAAFQIVSIMTSTGFASADFNLWDTFPKVVLLGLMFIGGCSASTAGGVKVARIVLAWRVVWRSVEREFRPRAVRTVRMNGQPVEEQTINEVFVFLVLVGVFCLAAVPLISVFEPSLNLQGALSAVFACLFNIGPGFGDVGPMSNYGGLHAYTKVVLGLLMIMGRLEFYAVLVLFAPGLWRKAQ